MLMIHFLCKALKVFNLFKLLDNEVMKKFIMKGGNKSKQIFGIESLWNSSR